MFLLYVVIFSLFSVDWLSFKLGLLPRSFTWIPEFTAILLCFYIMYKSIKNRIYINVKYFIILFFFVFSVLLGFVLNYVESGVIISGLRIYLRYIPFFLLLAVFKMSEEKFLRLLKFIFLLACIQFPVVLYQRLIKYSDSASGDPMGGTLGANTSGTLSLLLLFVLSIYIAFYIKNKINIWQFTLGLFVLLLPTTLNETKITFVLLPFCFLIPMIVVKKESKQLQKVVFLILICVFSFSFLKLVYDIYAEKRWGYGISEFIHMEGRVDQYASHRLDPVFRTIDKMKEEPYKFIFGVGAGNASASVFGDSMSGKYALEMSGGEKVAAGAVVLFWEIGFVGVFFLAILYLLIILDAIKLSKKNNVYGTFALGMVTVSVILPSTMFYANILMVKIISTLFWLFAGVVVQQSLVYEEKPCVI